MNANMAGEWLITTITIIIIGIIAVKDINNQLGPFVNVRYLNIPMMIGVPLHYCESSCRAEFAHRQNESTIVVYRKNLPDPNWIGKQKLAHIFQNGKEK